MLDHPKLWLSDHSGDLAMGYMVLVAGLNFVVLKDAVSDFSPLAFNAIRFAVAAGVMLPLFLRRLPRMHFEGDDLRVYVIATLIALPLMQLCLVYSLRLTTSANASLMLATSPAWTAVFAMLNGSVPPRRGIFAGLGVTLAGAALVILSPTEIAFSLSDLYGCAVMLVGAIALAWYVVFTKPIVDRSSTIDAAVIKHLLITLGVVLLAVPELVQIRPADLPASLWPSILFAGLVASISGTVTSTFALRKIGATRMKLYDNFVPISAAAFGLLFLGEGVTALQIAGGALTLFGVLVVRRQSRAGLAAVQRASKPEHAPA